MTTLLLGLYLYFKQVHWALVLPFVLFFVAIESIFLVANMFKFAHGGWVIILIAGLIAIVMYVWYNARIIRNNHMQFTKIKPYYNIISDIRQDESIPKYATNLVYLSKADFKDEIETKIIYSIINKQPKRADHYWLLHVDYHDDPSMLEYTFDQLIPNVLYKINLRLGFRVQPYINLYFRQIIEDLVRSKEFDLTSCYASLRKSNIQGDFRFVIINRIYSYENLFTIRDNFIMNLYNVLSFLETSVSKAFGLDTSNVVIEDVPLIVKPKNVKKIHRCIESR